MNTTAIMVAELLLKLARIYLGAGVVFALSFVAFGLHRLDAGAHWGHGFWAIVNGIGFRILIVPGLCAFWPLFVLRWIRNQGLPTERNAHRLLAKYVTPEDVP